MSFKLYKNKILFTNYFSLFSYSYMVLPFLFELRALMDWIWTETSMPLFEWLKMEDIFANIYELKVNTNTFTHKPLQPARTKCDCIFGVVPSPTRTWLSLRPWCVQTVVRQVLAGRWISVDHYRRCLGSTGAVRPRQHRGHLQYSIRRANWATHRIVRADLPDDGPF